MEEIRLRKPVCLVVAPANEAIAAFAKRHSYVDTSRMGDMGSERRRLRPR